MLQLLSPTAPASGLEVPAEQFLQRKFSRYAPGLQMGVGIGVGLALGSAMDNVGAGLAIGIAVGIALGSGMQSRQGSDSEKEG